MAKEAEKEKEKGEEEAPAEAAPKKSKKVMLFAIIGVVALLLVGGGVAFALLKGPSKSEEKDHAADIEEDAATSHQEHGLEPAPPVEEDELQEGEEPLGAIFPLETFVVNLEGGRFLRAQIQLEFSGKEVPKRFFMRTVLVRDALITLLSAKSMDDLTSVKGRDALKEDIKDKVNEILRKEEISKVYFSQFIVQ